MASDTDSTRNEESDLVLTWSGRWTLAHRILAVNVLTLVLVALSDLYLDAFRNRLSKERVRQVARSKRADDREARCRGSPSAVREALLAPCRGRAKAACGSTAPTGSCSLDSWKLTGPTYRAARSDHPEMDQGRRPRARPRLQRAGRARKASTISSSRRRPAEAWPEGAKAREIGNARPRSATRPT
jgi:two-component system sensor histidine kinase ChvG